MSGVSGAPPVAVLMGGPSAEHDVSVVSGGAIAAARAARGRPVEVWFIALDGAWWRVPLADPWPAARAFDDPAALRAEGPFTAAAGLARLAAGAPPPVVWIALHGPFGEDGTVQALCEAAGLVYTGSGVAAASRARPAAAVNGPSAPRAAGSSKAPAAGHGSASGTRHQAPSSAMNQVSTSRPRPARAAETAPPETTDTSCSADGPPIRTATGGPASASFT
jgi:hypothetical protein